MTTTTKTRRPTQADRILRLLLRYGQAGVTRWDAVNLVGCFELASRIGELEHDGCTITRRRWSSTNRFGDPVRGMTYVLKHVPQARVERLLEREAAAS